MMEGFLKVFLVIKAENCVDCDGYFKAGEVMAWLEASVLAWEDTCILCNKTISSVPS